jgi:hypothetical protein
MTAPINPADWCRRCGDRRHEGRCPIRLCGCEAFVPFGGWAYSPENMKRSVKR